MQKFSLFLNVIGFLVNIAVFFAAPIYSTRIQDWWATRSKARIAKRIEVLEKELKSVQQSTHVLGTILWVILVGILNAIVSPLLIMTMGLASLITGLILFNGVSLVGFRITQLDIYLLSLAFFIWAIAQIIRSIITVRRRFKQIQPEYAESLKISLERLRQGTDSPSGQQ
jgi:hypothetical protein